MGATVRSSLPLKRWMRNALAPTTAPAALSTAATVRSALPFKRWMRHARVPMTALDRPPLKRLMRHARAPMTALDRPPLKRLMRHARATMTALERTPLKPGRKAVRSTEATASTPRRLLRPQTPRRLLRLRQLRWPPSPWRLPPPSLHSCFRCSYIQDPRPKTQDPRPRVSKQSKIELCRRTSRKIDSVTELELGVKAKKLSIFEQ